MSFETNPQIFRIGIRGRGGELLTPSIDDFQKMALRGDLPGLSLLYRLRRRDGVARMLTQLTGDLVGRVQLYWRELIYQRSPAGITRSGRKVNQSRMPVNWRGDYARAVRVRRQRYSAQVYVDPTVSRYLYALERGARALSERFFVGAGRNTLHEATLNRDVSETTQRLSGLSPRDRRAIAANRSRRLRGGEQGEGTARILEWARSRFGAGEVIAERAVTRGSGNRATTLRSVRVRTGIKKKETPGAISRNAYRLLIHIRTRGTKPAAIFSRLRNSMRQGGPLQSELDQVTHRWYESVKKGGELE